APQGLADMDAGRAGQAGGAHGGNEAGGEHAVGDALLEHAVGGVLGVDVHRVEITGDTGEQDQVGVGDGLGKARLPAFLDVFEVILLLAAHGRSSEIH